MVGKPGRRLVGVIVWPLLPACFMHGMMQGPDIVPRGKIRVTPSVSLAAAPESYVPNPQMMGRLGVIPGFEVGGRVDAGGGIGGFGKAGLLDGGLFDLSALVGAQYTLAGNPGPWELLSSSSGYRVLVAAVPGALQLAPGHQLLLSPTLYYGDREIPFNAGRRRWGAAGVVLGYRLVIDEAPVRALIGECGVLLPFVGPGEAGLVRELTAGETRARNTLDARPTLFPGDAQVRCGVGFEIQSP